MFWPGDAGIDIKVTWRFTDSYKWGYKYDNSSITHIRGLISPFITTHEPASTEVSD